MRELCIYTSNVPAEELDMRAIFLVCSLLVQLAFLTKASFAQTSDFTIIALPDTQNEAQFFPNVLKSQTQWIVANRAELNIQMVLGEGDIVNDFSSPAQQESSDDAFEILDNAACHICWQSATMIMKTRTQRQDVQ